MGANTGWRHFELVTKASSLLGSIGHCVLGFFEFVPVVGGLLAIAEKACCAKSDPKVTEATTTVFGKSVSKDVKASHPPAVQAFLQRFKEGKPVTLLECKPYIQHYAEILLTVDSQEELDGKLEELSFSEVIEYYKKTKQYEFNGVEELIDRMVRDLLIEKGSEYFQSNRSEWGLQNYKNIIETTEKRLFKHKLEDSYRPVGDNLDRIDEKDYQFAQILETDTLSKLDEALRRAQGKLEILLQQTNISWEKSPSKTQEIILAKKAMMRICLDVCYEVDFGLLEAKASEENKIKLEKIKQLDQIHSQDIDVAMLASFKEDHARFSTHLKVVIEGGGPTGLLLALTQFCSGADVCLFEKRDMLYNRPQIVKLDPKWLAMLKVYLGEKYYELFEVKGVLRSEETGEITVTGDIAVNALEDALQVRLTELMSMYETKEVNPIQRYALHEFVGVASSEGNGKFSVSAQYNSESGIENKKVEADIIICAGGKNSSIRETFLPSSVPTKVPGYYGVCSWIGKIPKQEVTKKLFPTFRNMFLVDQGVINRFNEDLKELGYVGRGLEKVAHPYIQTRTFENQNLIYIGMEIPSEVYAILKMLSMENRKIMQEKWFQRVLKSYGEKVEGVEESAIDKKFCATFPIDQPRLSPGHESTLIQKDGQKLLILAAGDALAAPHFMRYSGLTGAREMILNCEEYMATDSDKKEVALRVLQTKTTDAVNFVEKQGRAFLETVSLEEQREMQKSLILKSFEEAASKGFLTKKENDSYTTPDEMITLQFQDGYVKQMHSDKTYESFAQFQLEHPSLGVL